MSRPEMVMGLETEYGIYARGPAVNRVSYGHALTAANEAVYQEILRNPAWMGAQVLITEDKRNELYQLLANGSRFYTDVGHPELATPECASPRDAVIWDAAGEHIVQSAARKVSEELEFGVTTVKNLTDANGHTWGCHENYCVTPRYFCAVTMDDDLNEQQRVLATWFAIRQILIGGGKIGSDDTRRLKTGFQLSQRSDFIVNYRGNTTMNNRPMIQTRDEPHADKELWRRLHVICGDANRCQWSTYLKLGLTSLLLMLSQDASRRRWPSLPIIWGETHQDIMRFISHDADLIARYPVRVMHGRGQLGGLRSMSAAEIMSFYIDALSAYATKKTWSSPTEASAYREVLTKAHWAVEHLRAGRWRSLYGWLDWPTKRITVEEYLRRKGKLWVDVLNDVELFQRVRLLGDHNYAVLDPAVSIFDRLRTSGAIRTVVKSSEVARALSQPPRGRARMRSMVASAYPTYVRSANWKGFTFHQASFTVTLVLDDPMGSYEEQFLEALRMSPTPLELSFYLSEHPIPHVSVKAESRDGGVYARTR